VRVVLLTSRQTGRWVIPKGMADGRAEAGGGGGAGGVRRSWLDRSGLAWRSRWPLSLWQAASHGQTVTCDVAVFLLHVRRELIDWPESDQRVRAWFSLKVAATLVTERDLAKLILGAVSDKLMQRKVRRT
jgi:uncharacterized protein